jgi:Lyzozyme M1 (1,4-beta-N-acetylmuramidase)
MALQLKGIDISTFQGSDVDFNKLKKSGIDFVIIRAGYGNSTQQEDTEFENNYNKAKAANMSVGAYWYSYASSVVDAELEAKACLEVIKNKKFEYPIYYDIEDSSQVNISQTLKGQIIQAFCSTLEKEGYYVGVYASEYWLEDLLPYDVYKAYTIWVAQWNNECTFENPYDMWQYADDGIIDGVSGRVDLSYCYVDFPTIITIGGFNGYSKSTKLPTQSTLPPINKKTYYVVSGDTLSKIANQYLVTVNALVQENKVKYPSINANYIQAGWTLVIPTPNTTLSTTKNYSSGVKVGLNLVDLYVSATSTNVAATKTGTYYIWSSEIVNDRIRITNTTSNVGKIGQVTGWVKVSDL